MKERLTQRKHDFVLFRKDGQLIPPMNMSGQEVRKALERLAELEDQLESGQLVEVVRCKECANVVPDIITETLYPGLRLCVVEGKDRPKDYFCPYGKRKEQHQTGNPCEAAEGCGGFEGAE